MTWYYKDGEQEIGPISKTQLQELVHAKRIDGKTLVRNVSMNDWRPLAEMARRGAAARPPADQSPPAPPAPGAVVSSDTGAPPPPQAVESAVCSQCGRTFPKEQVVQFDNQVICAACKPIFVQRLREGVTVPGVLKYAGFWIRFGAKFIDGLIMAVLHNVIMIPLGLLFFSSASDMSQSPEDMLSAGTLMLIGLQQLIGISVQAGYNIFFIGRFGATLGKMACRIKVITPEGGRVTYPRAVGRHFAEMLSAFALLIGYIMAAFDGEKRALHDRICGTRVVHK